MLFIDSFVLFHVVFAFHFHLGPFGEVYVESAVEAHHVVAFLDVFRDFDGVFLRVVGRLEGVFSEG